MTKQNDELNLLGYTSSAPDFNLAPEVEVNYQDQADLPALEKSFKMLANLKNHYNSREALTYGVDLTVENQLIINTRMVVHIQELESLLQSTINQVKEKINGTR